MEISQDTETYLEASRIRRVEIAGQIARLRLEQDKLLEKEIEIKLEMGKSVI